MYFLWKRILKKSFKRIQAADPYWQQKGPKKFSEQNIWAEIHQN